MKKYLKDVQSIEELKKLYYKLAVKLHPDINNCNDEEFKILNNEYQELFNIYKDIHTSIKENEENNYYTATKCTNEAPSDFINIISQLLNLQGVCVELCGRWLWISGETKTHKEHLKTIGCKWCNNKKLWSWHFSGDSVISNGKYDINKIRSIYGSERFEKKETLKIAQAI